MKWQNQMDSLFRATQAFAFSLVIMCQAGCASMGYNKSDAAAASLQQAASDVQGQSRALEITMGSLDDIVTKPEPDLKPQFTRYSKALDNLTSFTKRNQRGEARIAKAHAAYLQEWDKQLAAMNYEVVRARSQARQSEVTNSFDSVTRRYHEAQDAMDPLLGYLNDVRRALEFDLTPNVIESIKPIATKARENADKVQLALGRLTTELTTSSASLSSVALQNAASTATNQPPQNVKP